MQLDHPLRCTWSRAHRRTAVYSSPRGTENFRKNGPKNGMRALARKMCLQFLALLHSLGICHLRTAVPHTILWRIRTSLCSDTHLDRRESPRSACSSNIAVIHRIRAARTPFRGGPRHRRWQTILPARPRWLISCSSCPLSEVEVRSGRQTNSRGRRKKKRGTGLSGGPNVPGARTYFQFRDPETRCMYPVLLCASACPECTSGSRDKTEPDYDGVKYSIHGKNKQLVKQHQANVSSPIRGGLRRCHDDTGNAAARPWCVLHQVTASDMHPLRTPARSRKRQAWPMLIMLALCSAYTVQVGNMHVIFWRDDDK